MGLLFFLLGVLFGCIVMALRIYSDTYGNLRIDQSDPDDLPYMFFELRKDYNKLISKKYVVLRVRKENYISQD